MDKKYNNILCIDMSWVVIRNFHASNKAVVDPEDYDDISGLLETTDEDGNKVYQDYKKLNTSVLQSILKVVREYNYEYKLVFLFDRGSYKYRDKKKFTKYKSNRTYDEKFQCCWKSLDYLKDFLPTIMSCYSIQIPGVEADDLGMYYSVNSDRCILYSSDKDWLQSVTKTTELHRPVKGAIEINTYADVFESNELVRTPEDFALLKSLEGDTSDVIEALPKDVRKTFGNLKNEDIIKLYKDSPSELDIELFEWISSNFQLSRLDHILEDTETQVLIKQIEEENIEKYIGNQNDVQMLQVLSSSDINFLTYFLGVLGKYNRLHN